MRVRVYDTPSSAVWAQLGTSMERSYEVHPIEGDRHQLRLWGSLPRDWADPLCRGLARAGVSIVRGFAKRGPDARWIASFELERQRRSTDPMTLDYLALAARTGRGAEPPAIAIDHYRLERRPEHDGSLFLEVLGPDQLGFLGGLLERLSFLSLIPVDMAVETGPGGVHDCFFLRGADGTAPGAATRRILSEVLEGRLCTRFAAAG